jgi:hypothetical protein
MQPFVRKGSGEDAARHLLELINRARTEMGRPDFIGIVYLLTAWGVKPTSPMHEERRP